MSDEKQEPKSLSGSIGGHEPLPAYELTNSGPPLPTDSDPSAASPSVASPGDSIRYELAGSSAAVSPSVASPGGSVRFELAGSSAAANFKSSSSSGEAAPSIASPGGSVGSGQAGPSAAAIFKSSLSSGEAAPSSEDEAAPSYEESAASAGAAPSIASPGGSAGSGPSAAAIFKSSSLGEAAPSSSGEAAPSYEASSSSAGAATQQRPIAIPRLGINPTDPFLSAYPPSMLNYGITPETWANLLDSLSVFLTANDSAKVKQHAADIAKEIGDVPKEFGKNIASHAKSVGNSISDSAKQGNYVGATVGAIAGTITVPLNAAFGIISTTLRIPGSTMTAMKRKPQTPRERADAYVAAANKNLFRARGLYAALLDTLELCRLLSVPAAQLLEIAWSSKDMTAAGQLDSLSGHIADVNVITRNQLSLRDSTLWLVVTKA